VWEGKLRVVGKREEQKEREERAWETSEKEKERKSEKVGVGT